MGNKLLAASRLIQIKNISRAILALLALFLIGMGSVESVKQELWMHMRSGYVLYFDTHNPDLTSISSLFPIEKLCAVGRWHLFPETSFISSAPSPRAGSLNNEVFCQNYTHVENASDKIKSLRRIGGSDTTNQTLSLYSRNNWNGNEITITSGERARIRVGISNSSARNSLSYVGSASNWTLFEGQNLNGKSVCFFGRYDFNFVNVLKKYLTTVGSVFYGCDSEEIKRYREEHLK